MNFKEYLQESKEYSKKGRALVLKSPLPISNKVDILGLSRDTNGNSLLQLSVLDKKKSIQYKSNGMSTISIEELVDKSFLNRKTDIDDILKAL